MNVVKQPITENEGLVRSYDLDRLRIAVIAEDLCPPLDEGAKKASFHLVHSLMDQGALVSIFTRHKSPFLKNVFPLPANKLLFGKQFARNLQSQSPDVILYIPSSSGTVGAFVRASMIKMQFSGAALALLSLQFRNYPAGVRYLGFHRSIDLFFAQSQASAGILRSFGCRTVLLPGGVDGATFQPVDEREKSLLRARYGFQESDQIFLHVGHGNRGRNILALTRLAEAGYRVIFIASTSTEIDLSVLAELKQAGVTVITDFVENIQHFYQLSDCYIFPVFYATSAIDLPLSVLEAMACNSPVITTMFGALPDMFETGKGFYFIHCEEDLVPVAKQALQDECETADKVLPYSWDLAASVILEAFKNV